jgi:hypothetical protein
MRDLSSEISASQISASQIRGFDQHGNIFFRMRGGDDPMQAVGWSHVDTSFEQTMNEARVEMSIHIRAIVTVVVDGVTIGKVNLEHGTETLHYGVQLAAPKNFAQA